MTTTLSKSRLEAALAYARWLHLATFIRWQNTYRRECGLPIETPPVCLNTGGRAAYEVLRKALAEENSLRGAVLLGEEERRAVVAEILRQLHGGSR